MVLKGAYCLCIYIAVDAEIDVGALGRIRFPRGRYIYVGSAMNGLEARVRRHMNTSRGIYRAIHWHIDYLLKEPEVSIESIYIQETDRREECVIASAISELGKPVKGFGCSDCRCFSHLFMVEEFTFLTKMGLETWRHLSPPIM